jgi:Alcohol acetyltransferase
LGFYNALVIAAVYEFADEEIDFTSTQSFVQPLKYCVQEHSYLNVIVKDKHTEKPFFERVSSINLEDHISIIHDDAANDGSLETLEKILPPILDRPWPAGIPAWRVFILSLPSADGARKTSCFVAFAFSHTLGDGVSGLAFHRTLLDAWRNDTAKDEKQSFLMTPSSRTLSAPFDTPERLPISWKFLLGPLIAVYVPKFLGELLGLRAAASTVDAGTWTGSHVFFEPKTDQTRVKLLEIEAPIVQKALQVSRNHDAKLTAVTHQLIIRALSRAIPDRNVTNFVSGTAIDMRGSIGIPGYTWGLFTSGYFAVYPRLPDVAGPVFSDEMWANASSMTKKLSECATTLQDQPIGLLRYAPSIREWTLGKIGQQRDCSYEVSNLLAFDGGSEQEKCKISKVVFTQPLNVPSAPLLFSIVSVKGGSLMCGVSWQAGALGLSLEKEMPFVEEICSSFRAGFTALSD